MAVEVLEIQMGLPAEEVGEPVAAVQEVVRPVRGAARRRSPVVNGPDDHDPVPEPGQDLATWEGWS